MLALTLVLGACGAKPLEENASAEQLFNAAKARLNDEKFGLAADAYRELLSRYPYGIYAQQGQIDLTYALYKDEAFIAAAAEADRFINLYPSHPYVDYLFYLKGLSSFHEDDSFWGRVAGRDDLSQRDPVSTRQAFEAYRELVTRFPDSQYADDARDRMQYLRSTMARHDLNIA
ncbi:outer membrane protein assembly factor BamD, partial [Gammaproteobacteria bacterium]|nr:outer membrane protein assembly factor BamD [Gammaproteobacteria bacterium]